MSAPQPKRSPARDLSSSSQDTPKQSQPRRVVTAFVLFAEDKRDKELAAGGPVRSMADIRMESFDEWTKLPQEVLETYKAASRAARAQLEQSANAAGAAASTSDTATTTTTTAEAE